MKVVMPSVLQRGSHETSLPHSRIASCSKLSTASLTHDSGSASPPQTRTWRVDVIQENSIEVDSSAAGEGQGVPRLVDFAYVNEGAICIQSHHVRMNLKRNRVTTQIIIISVYDNVKRRIIARANCVGH